VGVARGHPSDTVNVLIGSSMLENYLPVLIFLGIASVLGAALVSLGFVFGPRRPDSEKLSPYECGFEAFESARMKFDVRYYLVAILFIIFDLEIAFLFPWAVSLDASGMAGMVAMAVFLLILVVGFIYEWKKGALEWD
jgi:NADH-quinone oxidoreductase subunit A